MNSFVLALIFIILYIIKGIVWAIVDVFWLKTTYGSFNTTLTNIILWPLSSLVRILDLIKNYINK